MTRGGSNWPAADPRRPFPRPRGARRGFTLPAAAMSAAQGHIQPGAGVRTGARRGFTLLEMMVATVIMGIAVVGLLSGISTSMRNAARLTDYDRAVMLARTRMDELLLDRRLPLITPVEGRFDPALAGGIEGGWRARLTPFEMPPNPAPGTVVLQRLELEIWWMSGGQRRTFALDGYRTSVLSPQEAAAMAPQPQP